MANAIVNATGAAFGQLLVNTAGFRWVVVSDEHGTEMAIIALEGTADVVVYPMNLVAKRYETKERASSFPSSKASGTRSRRLARQAPAGNILRQGVQPRLTNRSSPSTSLRPLQGAKGGGSSTDPAGH
jgi:hypothetical protein